MGSQTVDREQARGRLLQKSVMTHGPSSHPALLLLGVALASGAGTSNSSTSVLLSNDGAAGGEGENIYGIDWSVTQDNSNMVGSIWLVLLVNFFNVLNNAFIITAIQSDDKLRTSIECLMVVSLSVTDFAFGTMQLVFTASAYGAYPSYTFCSIQSFLIHTLCATSIMLLLFITVERYFLIIKQKKLTRELAKKIILAIYCTGAIFGACPLVGFGHYELQPSKVYCFARGGRGVMIDDLYVMVSIMIIASTVVGMIVLYTIIWRHISGVFAATKSMKGGTSDSKSMSKERKTVMQFIIITAVFVTLWTPALLKFITEAFFQSPVEEAWFDIVVGIGAALNGATNPIIYGIMNKKIGDAMVNLASWMVPCCFKDAKLRRVGNAAVVTQQTSVSSDDADVQLSAAM